MTTRKADHSYPQRDSGSIPHIALVETQFVFTEKCPKLVWVRRPLVVFLLICNILLDLYEIGLAYRKRRIAGLSLKIGIIRPLFIQPEV